MRELRIGWRNREPRTKKTKTAEAKEKRPVATCCRNPQLPANQQAASNHPGFLH